MGHGEKLLEMYIENKIKYLEMIQGVIIRLASNSFMLKGWAVTLITGTFALSVKESNSLFFLIAYVPVVLFWFLDSYYLQLERKYRKLYDIVVGKKDNEIDFKLSVLPSDVEDKTCFLQSLLSCVEVGFYLPTAVMVAIVNVLIN